MTINKTLKRRDIIGKQIQMSACVIFLKRGSVQTNIFTASRNIWNVLILWGCGISRHHLENHLRVTRRWLYSKTSNAAVKKKKKEKGASQNQQLAPRSLVFHQPFFFLAASVYQIHRCKIPSGRQTAKYYRLFGLTAAKCCKRQAASSSSARSCRFFVPAQQSWRGSMFTFKVQQNCFFVCKWGCLKKVFLRESSVICTVIHLNYSKN